MVAAGVYLTARIFPILTPEAGQVIAYVGGFTAFFAATIAVAQNDIKRVLAYSTVSQLGYMVMSIGAGAYTAGFFHLVTHAMFKAALFLGSGSVIHAMHHALHHSGSHADPQDMRNMGGLKKYMPTTFTTFVMATIALAGVPLTSGFLSKDAILGGTLAYARLHPGNWPLVFFGFGAAALTAFYMFRLIFLTFYGTFRGGEKAEHALHESPKNMTTPLVVLASLTIFFIYTLPAFNPTTPKGGWFATLIPTPAKAYATAVLHEEPVQRQVQESELVHGSTASVSSEETEHEAHIEHSSHNIAMVISIFVAGLGIWIAYLTYYKWKISAADWQKRLGVIYQGMYRKWWMDEIYNATVISGAHRLARSWVWFDVHVIDGIVDGSAWCTRSWAALSGWFDNTFVDGAVNGTAAMVGIWGKFVRMFQTGQVQRYMLITLIVIALALLLKL
jgi:NADH-quinone oxidoreductase subunit L